jgi:alpha/beta superfamily hydrolase
MDEYIHLRLARLLNQAGFSVIRFNQYGDEPRARKLHDSTISEHVSDTKEALAYAIREGYSTMVLAGHSLRSPVAIAAAEDSVSGLINPASFIFEKMNENCWASAILAQPSCAVEDNKILACKILM